MAYRTKTIVPESTVPGTRSWAETVAANARRYAAFTEKDVRPLVERYRQLRDQAAWDLWYPGQMEARERFFRDVVGYEAEFLDTMSKGVEILDGSGHEGPITPKQAERALSEHRGRTITERNSRVEALNSTRPGSAEYFTARLRRDAQSNSADAELLDQLVRNEITAEAAARKKGWRPPRIYVTSPERTANALRQHMKPDARRALGRLLLEED